MTTCLDVAGRDCGQYLFSVFDITVVFVSVTATPNLLNLRSSVNPPDGSECVCCCSFLPLLYPFLFPPTSRNCPSCLVMFRPLGTSLPPSMPPASFSSPARCCVHPAGLSALNHFSPRRCDKKGNVLQPLLK